LSGVLSAVFVVIGAGAAFAQGATVGFGTSTQSAGGGTSISDATDQELSDAFTSGLTAAGASAADIAAIRNSGQLARAIADIRTDQPRSTTRPFFTPLGAGITKWAIVILPGMFRGDLDESITRAHEAGHQAIDRASTEALNHELGLGTIPAGAPRRIIRNFVVHYENAANKLFHALFGGTVAQTRKILKTQGGGPGTLETESVSTATLAAEEELDSDIESIYGS
jgi:hypothetical protein